MIFVYDILVNFNDYLYNFYEWNKNDILEHIRKIYLFRVSDKTYNDFINYKVILPKEILITIKNKTEIFSYQKLENIKYACIVSNTKDSVALIFDENGYILESSKMPVDVENELNNISLSLKIKKFNYNKSNKSNNYSTFSREERKLLKIINYKVQEFKNDKEIIEYLYYEWFLKKTKSNNKYKELIKDINKKVSEKHYEFLKVLNLIKVKV